MGDHDGLGLAGRIGVFELVDADVGSRRIDIDEDRHAALLNDRGNRGGKAGGHGDDFVAGAQAAIAELVRSKRGNGGQS